MDSEKEVKQNGFEKCKIAGNLEDKREAKYKHGMGFT